MPRVYTKKPRKSKSWPTRSQLTNSSFLQTVYSIYDNDISAASDPEALREAAQALRDAGEECQGSLDNMPESLQYSPTGELLQTRIDSCESCADEIEQAADELEETLASIDEREEEGDEEEDWEQLRTDALDAARDAASNEGDWG